MTLYEQPWPGGDYSFFQLGFVVDDLVGAAGRWAAVHGVGPFHVLPRATTTYVAGGETSEVEMQIAVAQAGPVQIELIQQHAGGPTIFHGFRGLHQLCTVTDDVDAKVGRYRAQGYDVAAELTGRQRVAFVDTFADFGFYTEVVEGTPRFLDDLAGIARTCAGWDGRDPVRLLTRDGYRTP